MAKFNEMVKEFRLSINQSEAALALLLQLKEKEYQALEQDWAPPDEILERICTLFQWNYHDIRRLVSNSPGISSLKSSGSAKTEAFHDSAEADSSSASPEIRSSSGGMSFQKLLREARLEVNQSEEGLATLLNIPLDYYRRLERDLAPSDELLRHICALYNWNYRQIRQMLINQSLPKITPLVPPQALKEIQNKLAKPTLPFRQAAPKATLADRLAHERIQAGQTQEGIALLLNIGLDFYQGLEEGTITPDPELLKRIASLFQWNYNELYLLVKNSNIHQFQPFVAPVQPAHKAGSDALKKIQQEITQAWNYAPKPQQEMLLSQLEMIRDTLLRLKPAFSEPRKTSSPETNES